MSDAPLPFFDGYLEVVEEICRARGCFGFLTPFEDKLVCPVCGAVHEYIDGRIVKEK